MFPVSHPLQFLLVALAGWINQQQRDVIDYLQAENRVLIVPVGDRPPRDNRLACRERLGGLFKYYHRAAA